MKRSEIVKTINSLKGEEGHKKVLEVYNSIKPLPRGYKLQAKDPWCAGTVSAVFAMNGYTEIAECSCVMMISKAKKLGIWVENDAFVPQIGDIIMYDWQDNGVGDNAGTADHVGIVIAVKGCDITVREGNKNKTIGNRIMKVNGKYIRGFITPPYTKEKAKTVNPSPKTEKSEESAPAQSEYTIGAVYTVSVKTALNVRKGAGTNYPLVGYANLTDDAKKHAYQNGALKNGTRVTCQEVRVVGSYTWMRIPSGWVCAKCGNSIYVK